MAATGARVPTTEHVRRTRHDHIRLYNHHHTLFPSGEICGVSTSYERNPMKKFCMAYTQLVVVCVYTILLHGAQSCKKNATYQKRFFVVQSYDITARFYSVNETMIVIQFTVYVQ